MLAALQKGTVGELAFSSLLLAQSGGRLRTARPAPDDHGIDSVCYAVDSTTEAIFLQPKAALTIQPGGSYEFRVPLWEIPRGAENYFVVLLPITPYSPFIAKTTYLIPAAALLQGRSRKDQLVLRVPGSGEPAGRWSKYAVPRGRLSRAMASALGRPLKSIEPKFTASLRGRVLEDQLVCLLTLASFGQVFAWRPFADLQGIDVAASSPDSSDWIGIQVKGNFERDAAGLLLVHVPLSTLFPSPERLLVILEFQPKKMALGPYGWVIRTDLLDSVVRPIGGEYVFHVSPNPRSTKDNFLPWRYRTEHVPAVLIACLGARARGGPGTPLPSSREEVAAAFEEIRGHRSPRRNVLAGYEERQFPSK